MLTSYWVVNLGYAEPLELYDGMSGFDTTEAHEGLGYFVPTSEVRRAWQAQRPCGAVCVVCVRAWCGVVGGGGGGGGKGVPR